MCIYSPDAAALYDNALNLRLRICLPSHVCIFCTHNNRQLCQLHLFYLIACPIELLALSWSVPAITVAATGVVALADAAVVAVAAAAVVANAPVDAATAVAVAAGAA